MPQQTNKQTATLMSRPRKGHESADEGEACEAQGRRETEIECLGLRYRPRADGL